MAYVSLKHIDLTYLSKERATTALEGINLSIEKGEFISIIGPSGCGKTTLLSIIGGILTPTAGDVSIEGLSVTDQKTITGYMLQQDYLFPWLTIEENIIIGLKIMGKLTDKTQDYALSLLEQMGLDEKRKEYPSQLSGGMRQRVALVRMLATKPKVMLLDEPFSALDYQTKLRLEDLVFETLKQQGKTAVLVTHDIGEAIAMSDRIVLLSAKPGRIYKIFEVPEELRLLLPFQVRNATQYNELFQCIWKELETIET
ncbi:ABC transporter ATP-binding protein [Alkalihalobacillus sp. BA299]|uniref:ABC transporter ATP-binding protein n=1 Tax=Alkalihalobacillus sp. BA299 TaxID=2815938 RepID=UPI001ADA170B|nr:ABC transporter ATP-binding protein [Alkalihalobacillus sp. BA299]